MAATAQTLSLGRATRHTYHLRRFGATSFRQPRLPSSHCSFKLADDTECTELLLPYTGYCRRHILNDPLQQLYVQCSGPSCETPVLAYSRGRYCPRHSYLAITSAFEPQQQQQQQQEIKPAEAHAE